MNYGSEIKSKRKLLGLTTKETAIALGIGAEQEEKIKSWEKDMSVPPLELLDKIYRIGRI